MGNGADRGFDFVDSDPALQALLMDEAGLDMASVRRLSRWALLACQTRHQARAATFCRA